MNVIDAITKRASTRAFLDTPVSAPLLKELFTAARWAPSGVNTQPWKVVVASEQARLAIGDAMIAARNAETLPNPDYHYYPSTWSEPYKQRRRECGKALYGALDIKMDEVEKRKAAWYRNYHFFGAPVGCFFCIESQLERGSWLDMGMFIQNVMLAARGLGLETCPEASMAEYPDIVRKELTLPDSWLVVCGMAIGYGDPTAPVNQYRTTREPLESFLTWK